MAVVNPYSAVIAKAKAKYGKRLTDKDYAALVKCTCVSDIVRYLKTHTAYRACLDKVGGDIHRGQLEYLLREELLRNYLSLCRYNRSTSPVTGYIFRLIEVRELIHYLTLLAIGRPIDYLFTLPAYFDDHTELPLAKLSSADSYEEMLGLLSEHGYRQVLERYIPEDDAKIDIASISDAMEIYSLRELYNDIAAVKNKRERATLAELFDTLCDYNNYSRIIRLKRFYHLPSATVKEHLLPYGALSGKRLDTILSGDSFEEVLSALADTKVGRVAQSRYEDDEMAVQGRYDRCRHELYFSTDPEIVLLAYYIVSDTELKNIITIIEGVRYSLEPDSIRGMLIR